MFSFVFSAIPVISQTVVSEQSLGVGVQEYIPIIIRVYFNVLLACYFFDISKWKDSCIRQMWIQTSCEALTYILETVNNFKHLLSKWHSFLHWSIWQTSWVLLKLNYKPTVGWVKDIVFLVWQDPKCFGSCFSTVFTPEMSFRDFTFSKEV